MNAHVPTAKEKLFFSKHLDRRRKQEETPEMYKIKNIETVGGYAIQITWKDGHDTGIYSWDYIKKLTENQDNGDITGLYKSYMITKNELKYFSGLLKKKIREKEKKVCCRR